MDEENRESNGSNATTENIYFPEKSSLNHDSKIKDEKSSKEALKEEDSVALGPEVATMVDTKTCKSEITTCNGPTLNARNIDIKETQESVNTPGKTSTRTRSAKAENAIKTEKSTAKPIIVPIVLKMADFDHKALLEEWLFTRSNGGKCVRKDQQSLIKNLKTIQEYLCSFESQGMTVVNISATTFPQTLDWLHNHLLQCIERGCSSTNAEAGS